MYVARKAVLAHAPVCTLFRDPEPGEEYRLASRSVDECDGLGFVSTPGRALGFSNLQCVV